MKLNKKELVVIASGVALAAIGILLSISTGSLSYAIFTSLMLLVLMLIFIVFNSHKNREFLVWELEKLNNSLAKNMDQMEGAILKSFNQTGSLLNIHKFLPELNNLPTTRDWAASPDVLQLIIKEFIKQKPVSIIECGSGVSTLVFASLFKKFNIQGKIISLDHDSFYAEKTRETLIENGLNEYVTILDAPLVDYTLDGKQYKWYDLKDLPQDIKFDMAFIDGPPTNTNKLARFPFYDLIKNRLSEKYTLIVDDAKRVDEIEMVNLWNLSEASLKVEDAFCEKGALIVKNY